MTHDIPFETGRALRRLLLLLSLLPAGAGGVRAQQTPPPAAREESSPKAVSYIFASPNRGVGLTLAEARRKLNSREEVALILAARETACRLGTRATVLKAVGSWADGVEHSVLMKVAADEEAVRYADARLGRRFRQKAVMHFQRRPSGAARMYIVVFTPRGDGDLARLSKILDRSGVSERTIVPGRRRTAVYVVDPENVLRGSVASAARRLNARWMTLRGASGFVGDAGDSSRAQGVFSAVIEKYESEHPKVKRGCEWRRERANSPRRGRI